MPIVSHTIKVHPLSDVEIRILDRAFTEARSERMVEATVCVITWIDVDNFVQSGRVRWGTRGNFQPGARDSVSASPFPGAWSNVPVERIISVRQLESFNP